MISCVDDSVILLIMLHNRMQKIKNEEIVAEGSCSQSSRQIPAYFITASRLTCCEHVADFHLEVTGFGLKRVKIITVVIHLLQPLSEVKVLMMRTPFQR
jgi:hypothetical protein